MQTVVLAPQLRGVDRQLVVDGGAVLAQLGQRHLRRRRPGLRLIGRCHRLAGREPPLIRLRLDILQTSLIAPGGGGAFEVPSTPKKTNTITASNRVGS